jgi:glutamyl-tRNA synthetase
MTDFLYRPEPVIDPAEWDKGVAKSPAFAQVLTEALARFTEIEWEAGAIQQAVVDAGQAAGVEQVSKAQAPIRLTVTGRSVGPPLWQSLEILGRDRTVARLRTGLQRLQAVGSSG